MSGGNLEDRMRLVAIARTWLLTPYHHAAKIKGVGVDCATLLLGVGQEAGLVPPDVELPKYGPQWHLHRRIELYRSIVLQYCHEVATPQAGDIVLYRWGHVKSHGGIVTETGWPNIIHAYSRARAVIEARGDAGELAGLERQFFSYW